MATLTDVITPNTVSTVSTGGISGVQKVYGKSFNDLIDNLNKVFNATTAIEALTVTGTTTLNGTLVLGDAAADSLTINATTTYSDIINYSNETGITAFATGGQASATALTEEINNITICATEGDSVKLPAAVAGKHIYVKNSGATALDIFPASSDSIDALAVNLAVRIQPGSSINFYSKDTIVWESDKDSSITVLAPTTVKGQLEIKATDSTGNTVTTITNASQAAARTYTIPDAGANASFVMSEGAQTINGNKTLGGVLLASAGSTSAPSYSFSGDPNTGVISSTADAIGFVTGGTEQWLINSSGALNPITDNAHDIGNGSVNSRDIYITRGIKGVSTNFGTRGIANSTCTLEHFTTGKDVVTVITLTNYIVAALAGAAAAKVLVPANPVFTFPAGAHILMASTTSLGLTAAGTAVTPDVGLGSVVGDGTANATLNLSAAGAEDILTGYAIADTVTHAAVASGPVGATAGMLSGIALNATADVKTVYLNAAATWNADNTGNLTATGTIVLKWTIM